MYYLVAITPTTNLSALYTYTVAGTLILAVTSCAEAIFFIFYGHIYITVIVRSLTGRVCAGLCRAVLVGGLLVRSLTQDFTSEYGLFCTSLSLLHGGLGFDMC